MAYVTLADLKGFVGIPALDVADDTTLQRALDAAEEQVNAYTGRRFTAEGSASVRYYRALSGSVVEIDPLATTTDLAVALDRAGDGTFEETLTLDTHYRLAPYKAAVLGAPWSRLVALTGTTFPEDDRRVRVTGRYGYATVPASVKQATLIIATKLWKRKDAPFGIAGSVEFGSEMRILPGDLDAERLLRPYRHIWAVA